VAVAFGPTTNTGNATSVTSRAPTVPAGAAVDDVMILYLDLWVSGGADPTPTVPSGFTQVYKITGGTGVKSRCYWKRLTGADAGTYAISWTGAQYAMAHVIRCTGVTTSGDPIGANFNTATATSTTFPTTTVSPAYAPGLLWHGYSDSPATHLPPTSFTELNDVDCGTDAWRVPGSAGTWTAPAATTSVSSAINAGLIALDPGGGAAAIPPIIVMPPRRP
jgi:hypothetical protein